STGEIRVVGPLDSQQQKSYRLVVQLTDTHNDLDLRKRQSRLCDVSTLLKEPLVVTQTEAVWHPPAWFVAVLTISGALLLATLGCTGFTAAFCSSHSNRAPGKLFLGKR
uniref:Uncharacterized protein n=1 Tax=Corvus moneduloides TaxID=1196302 RepID=A0A8C3D5E3_CORMO